MWKRLLDVGIKGKMWRVIRDTYRRVRSAVVLDDRVVPPIETEEGRRQGSCLSPVLFSIFIASVITEWRRLGIGVRIGGGGGGSSTPVRTIAGLLFADDIVLVAETAAELQAAMDVIPLTPAAGATSSTLLSARW